MSAPAKATKAAVESLSIQHALVALELGDTDAAILNYLKVFSDSVPVRHAAFLHVLPAFHNFDYMLNAELQLFIKETGYDLEKLEQLRSKVNAAFENGRLGEISFDLREGDPLAELIEDARVSDSDLVVIGQKSGVSYHGIRARNLARKVTGNALIVPEKAEARLEHILVPIDFSDNSARALRTALSIAKAAGRGIKVTALHIYEMPDVSYYRLSRTPEQFRSIVESNLADSFAKFLSEELGSDAGQVDALLADRDLPTLAPYLLDVALDKGADLIVMGAKGHSRVELLLMGSVTEKLLTINSSIPTLIVK